MPSLCSTSNSYRHAAQPGAPLGPNTVLVGWLPCECRQAGGGHRTWQCRTWQCRTCEAVVYRPEHTGEHVHGSTPQERR